MFYLMERQGQSYLTIMNMPYSRRKRFVEKKSSLDRSAMNVKKNQQSYSRPRRRR
jgi:hypothetical protein